MTGLSLRSTSGGKMRLPRQADLYFQALAVAGAKAVFIGPEESVNESASRYAGFLIPGGGDIDPLLYNEEKIAEFDIEESQRVDFDMALVHAALDGGKTGPWNLLRDATHKCCNGWYSFSGHRHPDWRGLQPQRGKACSDRSAIIPFSDRVVTR